MMRWHERVTREMGVHHSDTVAVVRWGRSAKRGTRRRLRRLGRRRRHDEMSELTDGRDEETADRH